METKIKRLSELLAIFAGIFCIILSADELLPVKQEDETVVRTYEERSEEGKSLYIEYFILTNKNRIMQVPIETYSVIDSNDALRLYITPWLHQLKAFESISDRDPAPLHFGDPNTPRDIPFITGIFAIVFAFFSAFVIKRFELKVALAFFALIITAVRWWFIGV
jgi:hypothetical protein